MQGRLQMWSAAHCWFTLIHTWEKLIHADLHLKTSISGKRIYGSIMRSCDSMFLLAKGMRKVSSFVRSCLTKMRWTACMSFICHGGTEQEQKDPSVLQVWDNTSPFSILFPKPTSSKHWNLEFKCLVHINIADSVPVSCKEIPESASKQESHSTKLL